MAINITELIVLIAPDSERAKKMHLKSVNGMNTKPF